MTAKFYTGIGSRETPEIILEWMEYLGSYMEQKGYILRSGAAQGADSAFEAGVCNDTKKQIFLPWDGFNDRSVTEVGLEMLSRKMEARALEIAASHHPAWHRLSDGAKRLMARNVAQIGGPNLQVMSDLVICWTPRGQRIGGTALALSIADIANIPIMNLALYSSLEDVLADLEDFFNLPEEG